MTCQALAR
jgi:hypothetical protein